MIQKISVLALLGICSIEDLKTRKIHTIWLAVFAAEGLAGTLLLWQRPVSEIIAAMMPGVLILVLSFAAQGDIGRGDGMILIIMGIFLKSAFILGMLMLAVFLSAGYALFLYIVKKKSRKYEIAFVPFMFAACIGEMLIENYY